MPPTRLARIPILLKDSARNATSVRSLVTSTNTDAEAAEAAEEKQIHFRDSLSPSLRVQKTRDEVAPFKQDEIVLGPKLGSGEFSHVYEVQSFDLQPDTAQGTKWSSEELKRRLHMKDVEKYRQTDNARYALKHIKEGYQHEHGSDEYVQAARDLALEAEFLANLSHPNIIKLRGLPYSGAAGFADGPCGFYLIIDRLFETLDERIRRWHGPIKAPSATKRGRQGSSIVSRRFNSFNLSFKAKPTNDGEGIEIEAKDDILDECLSVALEISAAMTYLHSHSIVFRDLKPANIGFDVRGDVKIFDFGLARIVPEDGNPYTDVFEMSGAGSPRYMAPECLIGEDYNMKADVYTFAIVLWEMLSGETPYSFVRNRDQFVYHVVEEGGRPDIVETWPAHIRGMLESSFSANMNDRPKMKLFYSIIRKALMKLRGSNKGLNDKHINRRRTMESPTRDLRMQVARHNSI